MAIMWNKADCDYQVGDTVWISSTYMAGDDPYPAEVVKVIEQGECKELGKHYLLYVTTSIDNFLELREAQRCYRSKEAYKELSNKTLKREREMLQGIKDAVAALKHQHKDE